MQKRANSNK